MPSNPTAARKTLEAWRTQRADRLDPLRFHFIDALERRAVSHDGNVRHQLDEKLSVLLQAYADDLAKAPVATAEDAHSTAAHAHPQRGPLSELLDGLSGDAAMLGNAMTSVSATPQPAAFPELPALDAFRSIWTQVRSESQLRQSLQQVPEDAGPLNSGVLVHRAIALMRAASPGYLQHFLSYVDNLSWMERLQGDGVLETPDQPRTTPSGKPSRAKPRKRRD